MLICAQTTFASSFRTPLNRIRTGEEKIRGVIKNIHSRALEHKSVNDQMCSNDISKIFPDCHVRNKDKRGEDKGYD